MRRSSKIAATAAVLGLAAGGGSYRLLEHGEVHQAAPANETAQPVKHQESALNWWNVLLSIEVGLLAVSTSIETIEVITRQQAGDKLNHDLSKQI